MKLLTAKEVAAMLKAKASTVYAWAEQGMIPCLKVNGLLRFSEEAVLEWLESCQKPPAEGYNISAGRRPKKGG
jgi:excisionase family DNA binding protein